MIICAAGDIHGALDRMCEDVRGGARQASNGLHVGDFGIWPDANRIDKATKRHDSVGDFPTWFAERRSAQGRSKENHEDDVAD